MLSQAMAGLLDDPFQAVFRWAGRQTGNEALPFENPRQMVNALNNPALEAKAVARMHKMHYGAFYGKETRGPFSGLAERELLNKGVGKFGWRSGLIQGRPMMGWSIGVSHFKGMVPIAVIQGIFGGFTASRGHKVSGSLGGFAKGIGFATGDLIGTALGGPMLGYAVGAAGERVGAGFEEGVQMLHDFAYKVKHINMGGNYEDTQIAYSMRQRAAQELGSSVLNARQWLGKEAAFMHQ